MLSTMRPDMRTWVEAALTKHLRDNMPLDSIPGYMIGRILAQLLRYWRYSTPQKWQVRDDDLDYSLLACRIREHAAMDAGMLVGSYGYDIYSSLDKGDWKSMAALPGAVWKRIEEMTSITKEEWTILPQTIASMLDDELVCTGCAKSGVAKELGRLVDGPDPFDPDSPVRLVFECNYCDAELIFKEPHTPIQPRPRISVLIMKRLPIIAVGIVCIIIYLYLRRLF